jgi:hypothetical protein
MAACFSISISNSEVVEHSKAIICTINYSYTSLQQRFQALFFGGKYILHVW